MIEAEKQVFMCLFTCFLVFFLSKFARGFHIDLMTLLTFNSIGIFVTKYIKCRENLKI